MEIAKIKIESRNLLPVVIIGKNGINEEVINHIKRVIKKKKLIKIKLLHSYIDLEKKGGFSKKQIGQKLADLTGSKLIEVMGLTVSLAKKDY